jgi:hypothetical protein
MFEHSSEKLIPKKRFVHRMLKTLCWALLVIGASLFIGVACYHYLENLPWIDSMLNASMILGGMGPVDPMKTFGGKLFASIYALYSGLVLIALTALLLAPVFHRVLHAFHEARE